MCSIGLRSLALTYAMGYFGPSRNEEDTFEASKKIIVLIQMAHDVGMYENVLILLSYSAYSSKCFGRWWQYAFHILV